MPYVLVGPAAFGSAYKSFDDEVTRHLFWRNLIDPYAREWQNDCGRWDLLDVVRTAYALRPDGMEWPLNAEGKPSFKLTDLSAASTGALPAWPVWEDPTYRKGLRSTPGGTRTIIPSFIPKTLIPKAILEGSCDWYGNESFTTREAQFVHWKYPADGCSKIHMIWTDSPSWITCWNDGNNFIRAMRHEDIEFIMCQHPWLENDCLFADVILPVNTKIEEQDINADFGNGQFRILLLRI